MGCRPELDSTAQQRVAPCLVAQHRFPSHGSAASASHHDCAAQHRIAPRRTALRPAATRRDAPRRDAPRRAGPRLARAAPCGPGEPGAAPRCRRRGLASRHTTQYRAAPRLPRRAALLCFSRTAIHFAAPRCTAPPPSNRSDYRTELGCTTIAQIRAVDGSLARFVQHAAALIGRLGFRLLHSVAEQDAVDAIHVYFIFTHRLRTYHSYSYLLNLHEHGALKPSLHTDG